MRSITAIQADIDSTEAAIQAGGVDRSQIDVWNTQIADFKIEMQAAQDQAQTQQQAQAEQINGLKEIIRSIRDAVYLKELMDRALGLTENEKNMQDFNSMVDQAVDEDQIALHEAFKSQLEQRDEKFRTLTSQALDVQNQLDKANGTIQTQAETITGHEKTIGDLFNAASHVGDELHQKDIEIQSLEQQLENAKETIFNLQKQINNVPAAPQIIDITPTKASESLADKIAKAKIASVTKFSNLYSEVLHTDGTKEVVHNSLLPTLEIPVLPTLEQVASQNVEQSANTEQVIHPSDTVQNNDNTGVQAEQGNEVIPQMVGAAEETTLTLESLKAEVDAIKSHLGLVA